MGAKLDGFRHTNPMRMKKLSFALPVILLLSGCAGSNSSNQNSSSSSNKTFLKTSSTSIDNSGLAAYRMFEIDTDKFADEVTWELPSKFQDKVDLQDKNRFSFMINQLGKSKTDKPELMIFSTYLGQDWLFQESVQFKLGNKIIELKPDEEKVQKVMDLGYVLEVLVFILTDEEVESLSKALDLSTIEVRVNGQYPDYEDTTLSSNELFSLKKTLMAFRYMRQNNIDSTNHQVP
jgi:hypothetical protein